MDEPLDWSVEANNVNQLCELTLSTIRCARDDRCCDAASHVVCPCRQRDKVAKDGGDVRKLNNDIKKNLQVINTSLQDLENELSSAEQGRKVMSSELARREGVVIDLISYRDRLELLAGTEAKPTDVSLPSRSAAATSALPAPTVSMTPFPASAAMAGSDAEDVDEEGLFSRQQGLIEQQDRTLDELSGIMSRQQHVSLQIADELDSQIELLTEFEDASEHTQSLVNRASRKIHVASKQAGGSRNLAIFIILLVAVIVLGIIAFSLQFSSSDSEDEAESP